MYDFAIRWCIIFHNSVLTIGGMRVMFKFKKKIGLLFKMLLCEREIWIWFIFALELSLTDIYLQLMFDNKIAREWANIFHFALTYNLVWLNYMPGLDYIEYIPLFEEILHIYWKLLNFCVKQRVELWVKTENTNTKKIRFNYLFQFWGINCLLTN